MILVEVPRYRITTPATVRPVSVSEAKEHLNVFDYETDAKISKLIDAAVEHTQDLTGRSLITQTITLTRDCFPAESYLELPRGAPLQSVTSVKYTPLDTGIEATFSSASYRVDTSTEPGRIWLRDGEDWPSDDLIEVNGVTIVYLAGYGVATGPASTFTVTIAAPGVFTATGHDYSDGDGVKLSTTGALPTGLAADTLYYVRSATADTYQLSATRGGVAITTTGTQSGTHTVTGQDGRPTTMPHSLQQAVLLLVGHWFENREATTDQSAGNLTPTPMGYDRLIAQHRVGGFA